MLQFWNYPVFNNELWRYGVLFLVIFGALAVGRLLRFYLEKHGTRLKEKDRREVLALTMQTLAKPLALVVFAIGFQIALTSHVLKMSPNVAVVAEKIALVLRSLSIAYLIYKLVDIPDHMLQTLADRTESKIDDMLVPLVRKTLRVIIVIIAGLYLGERVLGQRPATLLASLGVGGLAIALAARDTISNFFGSLMILADKPFQVGDRIEIDGKTGNVEEVGFRSTKIRTLSGHLVTIPNSLVASSCVENIGARPYIRRTLNVTVTYDTPPEKLARGVEIIKEILADHDGMDPEKPPRVHFNEFNDTSLNIIVIYWYHPGDYFSFLEFSEKFNFELLRRFNEEGIEFAFPTQTVFLAGDPNRPLSVGIEGEAEPGGARDS